MRRGLWWFALALGIMGACSTKKSDTKLMVAVWTNLSVPSEMDTIRIDAKGPDTTPSFNVPLTTGSAKDVIKFPIVWELVSPDDKGTAFDITASGYSGTSLVVSQTAHLAFDPGHGRVLTLYLDRTCMRATSGPCTQPIDIDVTTLPAYDPKTPFFAPDASPETPDSPGIGKAETGDVGNATDLASGAEVGDAPVDESKPDAGPEVSVDASPEAEVLSDTPADQPLTDDLGRDQRTPDSPCVNGCTQVGDAALDSPGLDGHFDVVIGPVIDAASDSPEDLPVNRDVSLDSPTDLPAEVPPDLIPDLIPDLGPDVAVPDDAGACVLPMTPCSGACINPQANPSHCGGCGQACGTQNGTPTCSGAVCSMASCAPGFLNCSADENTSRDGCETNGNTDRANCGHCGNVCSSRVCQNQVCLATARYGNTGTGTGVPSDFSANFLAGIQVYVPIDCVVTGFGAVLVSNTANDNMYLGLYKDVAGSPGALVATVSAPTLVTPGGKEMNVEPPVPVTSGTYWILGVWDNLASFASNSATSVTWRFVSYPFGALPATAPTSMQPSSGRPPNLYVIVAQ